MFSQVSDWPILPGGSKISMVSGIGLGDSRGHIHVAHRGARPLLSFDAAGRHCGTMGQAEIEESVYYKLNRTPAIALGRRFWIHGLSVDPWDNVWITDVGRHIVMKFNPDGKLALTMGVPDVSGESPALFNSPPMFWLRLPERSTSPTAMEIHVS